MHRGSPTRSWGPQLRGLDGTDVPNDAKPMEADSCSKSNGSVEVCAFDNRGMGLSTVPTKRSEYTTTIMAKDAIALLDHLGWSKAHVFGHSMGGMIACKLAAMVPERILSLALLNVTGGGFQCFPKLDRLTLSIAFRFMVAKTPEERAAVDLDTHYSQEYLAEFFGSSTRRSALYQIARLLPLLKQFTKVNDDLKLKEYELELFQRRLEKNEHHKLAETVKKIEHDLADAKSALKEKQLQYENSLEKVVSTEKLIKDHDSNRNGMLKSLEKKIKWSKTQMQSVSKELKGHENERENLVMQMEAVREERISLEKQLELLQTQIQSLKSDVKEQQDKVYKLKQSHDQAHSDLNSVRAKMKACDSEISGIIKEQQKLKIN